MDVTSQLLLVAILCIVGYWFYKYGTKNADYFTKRGIKFNKPVFLFGNNLDFFTRKGDVLELLRHSYMEYPNEKIVGGFDMRRPVFLIRDPDLIKQIGIKDFDHFPNHREFIDPDSDPLFMKSLFALKDQKWSQMRTTLSPVFTSSKMRNMFGLMAACGEKLAQFIKDESHSKTGLEVELKAFFSRFCNDVIATCAFGIEVDSYKDKDNAFYRNSDRMRNFQSPMFIVKMLGFMLAPGLMRRLKVGIIDKKSSSYFYGVLEQNFADREKHKIVRHDMVHLLMQTKKGNLQPQKEETVKSEGFAAVDEVLEASTKVQWTDDELIAQCFIFFFAGLESIASFLPFIGYELIANREIQEKLYQEILATHATLQDGEFTYEAVNSMKFLDMIVSEALRKWSPTPIVDRVCAKDYKLDIDGQEITVEKERVVMFPIHAIHYDPKYWPEPHKFMPERFNEENKRKIVSGSYIPFGIGPRNCIGSRFALLETKILFYYMLLNFSFEPTDKTEIPIKLNTSMSTFYPKNGIQIEFRPRNQ